jgi:hypothetical protein
MEPRNVVSLFQVHKAVKFREGETANVPEVLSNQILGELREHCIDCNQVNSLRFP